eukprot:622209-Heterocapsa_arctica.AAC.1
MSGVRGHGMGWYYHTEQHSPPLGTGPRSAAQLSEQAQDQAEQFQPAGRSPASVGAAPRSGSASVDAAQQSGLRALLGGVQRTCGSIVSMALTRLV